MTTIALLELPTGELKKNSTSDQNAMLNGDPPDQFSRLKNDPPVALSSYESLFKI